MGRFLATLLKGAGFCLHALPNTAILPGGLGFHVRVRPLEVVGAPAGADLTLHALRDRGVKDIYACCTHPVFSGPAIDRLMEAPIKELIVTDTIPHKDGIMGDKLKVVSMAPLLSETIRRICCNKSVSELF